MPTVVLNAYSKAYPFITNRIRAAVYLQSSPQALVATIIDTTAGHPERTWSFPGLPRNNYGFILEEINGSGTAIANLAKFDAVPGEIEGELVRDDEHIQVGGTPGFVAGNSSFVFDGTGGKPNYIGWSIVPSELTGRGILVRDFDYSWDEDTATLNMLQDGDVFADGNFWNIHFNPIADPAGNSYPTLRDFSIRLVTSTGLVDISDFGIKLIVEPDDNFITLGLPDIATVVEGRPVMVEVGGDNLCCVQFTSLFGQPIKFARGNIYAIPGESLSIYKFVRSGTPEWRVSEAVGNFQTVGRLISTDDIEDNVTNALLLNGNTRNKNQLARLYFDFIQNLPMVQVCHYDDWATGNNKYLYSYADSADPGNVDMFHLPDRTGLFERNNKVGKPGDWADESIKLLAGVQGVKVTSGTVTAAFGSVDNLNPSGLEYNLIESFPIVTAGATETKPANYLINKYVLI